MKEFEIRRIMQDSISSPSEEFTAKLVVELQKEKQLVRKTQYVIYMLVASAVACLFVFYKISFPEELEILDYQVGIPVELIKYIGVMLFFLGVNEIYKLLKNVRLLKSINRMS